jgi:hypothetical protein
MEPRVSDQLGTKPFDTLDPVASLLGSIKTFGLVGPPYKVNKPLRQLEDGDWLVQVTLVQTGEPAEYRFGPHRRRPGYGVMHATTNIGPASPACHFS